MSWQAVLTVRHPQAEHLLSALITEGGFEHLKVNGGDYYQVSLEEVSAKNLRAFWNTKLRSLEASEDVLQALSLIMKK